ncbi:MAG: glycosyltransferase family 39 protein, partial [Armatimonadota bacterium]|nr:glycosyltransferase family 39 protein [Armatimonadota bacterium]
MPSKTKAGGIDRMRKAPSVAAYLRNLSPPIGDVAIAVAIGMVAFLWLVLTAGDIGVGYDEPIYGGYALKYLAWLQLWWQSWARGDFLNPFRPEVIDLYWHAKDMHPPIPKLVAALGYALMRPVVGDDFAAMRSGTAFLFAAMLAALYWFGREPLTKAGALFAVGAVAFMPRLFADAHFLTMDSPVTATTLIATLALVRLLEQPSPWRLLGA